MRYLTLAQLFFLHDRILAMSGGAAGVRDLGIIEAALAQPKGTFGGVDLYPTVVEKAASLGFSLVQGHSFIDGNKRIGHAAMEMFLTLNSHALVAAVDDQERLILALASGALSRAELVEWLEAHAHPAAPPA
jgi:death on curing protein